MELFLGVACACGKRKTNDLCMRTDCFCFLSDGDVESRIDRLADEECSKVTKLALSSNLLINLPENVARLTNLRDLSLDRNGLVSLPTSLGSLTRLSTILLVGFVRLGLLDLFD